MTGSSFGVFGEGEPYLQKQRIRSGKQMIRVTAPGADALPDLFTALQEQLGLKLNATKAPVDVLVIDKVSKPSEN